MQSSWGANIGVSGNRVFLSCVYMCTAEPLCDEPSEKTLLFLAEKAGAVLQWPVVFDNVDRDYYAEVGDSQAYDIKSFLPAADHGSILITTRLAHLGELGNATKISRVDSK